MVDLYKDIDWDSYLENVDFDFFEFTKELRSQCDKFQKSDEFKRADIKKPQLNTSFSNFLLLTGLPIIEKGKETSFKAFLIKKILPMKRLRLTASFVNLELEFIDDKSTGNAILEFNTAEAARNAQNKLDGFDKFQNTWSAVTFDTFNDVISQKDTVEDFHILQRTEVLDHLNDKHHRDQLAVLVNETMIPGRDSLEFYWHNDVEGNVKQIHKSGFINSKDISFSQSGAYLANLTDRGAEIYAGKNFEMVRKIEHFGIKSIKFSPNDTYIATYNGTTSPVNGTQNIIVWNLLTGSKLRTFKCPEKEIWDNFSWSFDESYCACIIVQASGDRFLCVYVSSTMIMFADESHDKKPSRPIQVLNPQMFSWANTKNELAFVCWNKHLGPEASEAGIVQIPEGKIFKWIQLNYNIKKCTVSWECRDKFLIAYFDSSFKKNEHMVQIATPNYRMRKVDVKVINFGDGIHPYIWDVSIDKLGRNYVVFWSKNEKDLNYSCSYYKVTYKKKTIENKLSHNMPQCGFKEIEWSRIENLFYFKMRGMIQVGHFEDVNSKKPNKFTGILNEISVSPFAQSGYESSGRYIGIYEPNILKFSVYNAFGLLRFVKTFKGGKKILWRPIPETLIDSKVEKDTLNCDEKNNMKPLIDKFRQKDIDRKKKYEEEEANKAQIKEAKFFGRMKEAKAHYEATRDQREKLYGGDDEEVEDGIIVWYIDKKEEYDR